MTLRTTRAGTRSIAREEIKRVKKSLEKVRRWEKKWVVLEESGLKVYRWVPKPVSISNQLLNSAIIMVFRGKSVKITKKFRH